MSKPTEAQLQSRIKELTEEWEETEQRMRKDFRVQLNLSREVQEKLQAEKDVLQARVNALDRNRAFLFEALSIFKKIVPLKDVRDKIIIDLLITHPELLATYALDVKPSKVSREILDQIPAEGRSEILAEIRNGRKIPAIKFFRQYTGAGLREAKDAIDKLWTHVSHS